MKRKRLNVFAKTNAKRGFSLVELLTVVAIITLLIAILVPAVNKVRETAKITATQTTLNTLDTGLNMFRQNQQIGGLLPPSASDFDTGSGLLYDVYSPYSNLPGTPPQRWMDISGAGLLVWSLAGADLLGCPGFKTFRTTSQSWALDTSDGLDCAYELDQNTREPKRPREAPFIDLSKVNVSKWNSNALSGAGSFEIPAEVETAQTTDVSAPKRDYPMFIDDFGGPILYWRADPAGKTVADFSPSDSFVSGNRALRGIYHYADNAALLTDLNITGTLAPLPLSLTPKNQKHRLFHNVSPPVDPTVIDADPTDTTFNFARYIRNANVTAKITPYNADSFLLVSAGPDGLFGTADDIANFPHGGAALLEP